MNEKRPSTGLKVLKENKMSLNYVWDHYSFYAKGQAIPVVQKVKGCRRTPIRDEIQKSRIPSETKRRFYTVEHPKGRMVTDGGATVRFLRERYGMTTEDVRDAVGRLYTEIDVIFLEDEMGVMIKNEQEKREMLDRLQIVIDRLLLVTHALFAAKK